MPYGSFFRGRAVWTVLLGATFVCCSLIIYNLLSRYKTRCTSQESCSNSYQSESARLDSENCRNTCNTKECVEIANNIIKYMNRSADPCADFSAFACGNYAEQFERESNHSITSDLQANGHPLVMKDIIETSNETQIDGSAAQKLKIVYDSCINSKSSDLSAIRSMQQFLNQMGIPNWPHLDSNFSFRNTTFEETVGRLVTFQEDIFITFVESNESPVQDQVLYNITVEPESSNYRDDWGVEDLKKAVMHILYYTGMDNEDINRTWEEFMDMENGIRILFKENSEVNSVCGDIETRKSACLDCSHGNDSENMVCGIWDSVFRNGGMANHVNKDLVHIGCEHTHYMEKLPSILSSYNNRSLAHYIALRVFINNLKYMGFSIRKKFRHLIKTVYIVNPPAELDRWKFCIYWVAENMKSPLGIMYVSRLWGKDNLYELDDIVNEYKQTFIQFLGEQGWMDDDTKQHHIQVIQENVNDISETITFFRNISKINSDYRKFHPTRNDFFHNVMQHRMFQFIGKYWMTGLDSELFDVQAAGSRRIYISFGMLLPPYFKYGYPKIFNIANIGWIIGHELGHGVAGVPCDDICNGSVNATIQHYWKIIYCFQHQYSSYESKRIKQNVSGNETLGENLADNMSRQVTEKVAEQVIRTMEADNFTLPGLPYSPEELFYIYHAQMLCATRSIEMEHVRFETLHSPEEYRIIGQLQNSKRFSEVFHCPSTSYMNPKKRCLVFD